MPDPRGNAPLPVREALGLSQRDLAAELGVTVRTVQAWESGERMPPRIAERAMELLTAQK